jgi:hypothetical protein
MGSIEQRRHLRVSVDFFADWGWGPECEYYDRITSLSISGCFLATKRELRIGDEVFIRLSSEIAGVINLKGAVRHQLRVMEGTPPTGAGIEFLSVTSESERKLEAMVDRYK